MENLIGVLKEKFGVAFAKAFPGKEGEVEVTPSTQPQFGDYQCNSAMKWAKQVGMSPRAVAEKVLPFLEMGPFIHKCEIAGPGFMNITLAPHFAEKEIEKLAGDERLGIPLPEKQKRIVVDFSCPNIAKEMHVGHLRSTIIGDSLARLFEFLGYDVLRLNHVGDWGTSFGMLIAYIKEVHPELIRETGFELPTLMAWYKAAKKKFDEDPAFKKRSQQEVVSLQAKEPDSIKIWEIICEISRHSYNEIYALLDVRLIERGESFYNPLLPQIVQDLEKQGLIQISDGAKCLYVEGFINREGEPLPLMLQKSDGGYNYDTTDMAALWHRVKKEKADRVIYVTDAGQSTHFHMIFKAGEKAGYYDPALVEVNHVPFGLVLGPDGKKFKTRSGDTEKLIDLLTTAIAKAGELLAERLPDVNEEQRSEIAQNLGISAIKYADLSCARTGDYLFSYERMLKFEGNTAAFLMYAYVRTESIKRKVQADLPSLIKAPKIHLEHPSELALGLHLLRFREVLDAVARDLFPHRLTDYLFALAEKFNAFFRDCRVEGSPQQNSRLLLCDIVGRTLKRGMDILGLKTVERM